MGRVDLGDIASSRLTHDDSELRLQNIEHTLDAFLPEGDESPDVRPADADRIGAERQRLKNIRSAPHAAVHEYRYMAGDCRRDFGEAINRCAAAIFGAPSVVRNDDAVDAVRNREQRVLACNETLDDELAGPYVAQAFNLVPVHGGRCQVFDGLDVEPAEHRFAGNLIGKPWAAGVAGGAATRIAPFRALERDAV